MGNDWLALLKWALDRRLLEAAALLMEEHGRCQAARGVARGVGLARRGEAWTARWRGVGLAGQGEPARALRSRCALAGLHGGPRDQSLRSQRVQAQSRP